MSYDPINVYHYSSRTFNVIPDRLGANAFSLSVTDSLTKQVVEQIYLNGSLSALDDLYDHLHAKYVLDHQCTLESSKKLF